MYINNIWFQGVLPSSGSAKVDLAIASIRLLYLQQHRELQTKINELICEVQKITACPKCDLNLGRIGR
jgi:RLL motif-containing protein 1